MRANATGHVREALTVIGRRWLSLDAFEEGGLEVEHDFEDWTAWTRWLERGPQGPLEVPSAEDFP